VVPPILVFFTAEFTVTLIVSCEGVGVFDTAAVGIVVDAIDAVAVTGGMVGLTGSDDGVTVGGIVCAGPCAVEEDVQPEVTMHAIKIIIKAEQRTNLGFIIDIK